MYIVPIHEVNHGFWGDDKCIVWFYRKIHCSEKSYPRNFFCGDYKLHISRMVMILI